jgi:hypothetical protein
MALAFRSAANADEVSGSSITVNKPSGVVRGDILVAVVSAPAATLGLSGAAQTAWGSAETITLAGSNLVTKVWIRQAGASEAASWAGFTISPSAISSWACLAFSGGKGSDMVDASQSIADGLRVYGFPAFDSTQLSITPSGTGRLGIYIATFYQVGAGGITHTWAGGGITERVDEGEADEVQLAIGTGAPPPQSSTAPYPYVFNEPYNNIGSGSVNYNGIVIFLNPGSAPTITSVTQDHGPVSGGESITIIGTNFNASTEVTIGGTPCPGITVVSSTQVTATTPAGTVGAKTLAVYTDEGSATY